MTANPPQKKPHYGMFALAATIYTGGILAFSIWSYTQQRANILAQVDRSLINATHATEQILGDIYIACAVETHSTSQLSYSGNQSNLDRFAENCGFDLLGAIAYHDGGLEKLIMGGMEDSTMTNRTSCLSTLVCKSLIPMLRQQAEFGTDSIRMETIVEESWGQMRIAVRYHPINDHAGYAILVARNMRNVNRSIDLLAIQTAGIGILLYSMAFPLILLYNLARARSLRETAALHEQLRQDYIKLKDRESELEDAIHDLERFNALTIGREGRIIELKAEVNTLLEQLSQHKRYNVDHVD